MNGANVSRGAHWKIDGSNPFATRFIQPTSLPFEFPTEVCADRLVDRLAELNWCGQIVGPHGSGKSTLLQALLRTIVQRGHPVFVYTLHDRQRHLPVMPAERARWTANAVIVVDGYEQLSRISRWQLRWVCRHRGCGLLLTSHRLERYPLLHRTTTSVELLERLVDRLVCDAPPTIRPTADEVRRAFDQQAGNLRESLLQLYDVFEVARRDCGSDAVSRLE